MACPQSTEYNEAVQNLRSSVSDEELREGQPAVNALGLPMAWSGNFADVYKVHCPATGNTWAVKCFTREVRGLRERYREISTHLQGARLPFMVDFRYVEPGIRVGAQWCPFLKMRWVEGLSLNQFVGDYVESPKTLKLLLALWLKLALRLRQARVAHADLQHGNVLLVPMRETGQFSLKLIDYDGMYVPSLAGKRSGELGHPAYQHPERLREGLYNSEVDRFSHLAIYSAVRCLTVGKRQLWRRFDNGDNLLFREVDFQSPGKSEVFQELWALGDPDAHALIGRLILATQMPLDRVSLLTEVVSNGSVRRLSHGEQQQVKGLMDRGASAISRRPVSLPPWSSGDRARPFGAGERGPAFAAPEAGTPAGFPSAGSAGSAAGDARWWVSGQPGAARAQPPSLSASLPGVQAPASTSPRPGSSAHGRTRATVASGGLPQPQQRGSILPTAKRSRLARGVLVGLGAAAVVLLLLGVIVIRYSGFSRPLAPGATRLAALPSDDPAPLRRPAHLDGEITIDFGDGVTMELLLIPAGEFLMGSPDSDRDAQTDEQPQHPVRITEPFYLGKYEVTQEQWEAVMEADPSRFKGPKNPVEQVSWDECQAFLSKLNEKYGTPGTRFVLPTEAEWEYACRAGRMTPWSFGDEEAGLGDYAWYEANSAASTHPVGRKSPNGWGLYDMHGNVCEWCADRYLRDYYSSTPPSDPQGPDSGPLRVLRGGAWDFGPWYCRSAVRSRSDAGYRHPTDGFRVARRSGDEPTVDPAPKAPESASILPPPAQPAAEPPEAEDDKTAAATPLPAVAPFDAGKAKEFQSLWATHLDVPVEVASSIGMKLILIPPGEFLMGSPDSDNVASADEKPRHQVRITRPFYMGKYEVTQEQYQRVMGTNPSGLNSADGSAPVESVSWEDAAAFCQRLSASSAEEAARRRYRLPTEAEWEYACRAGTTTRWSFGDDEAGLVDYAWFVGNSSLTKHPAGRKKPNAWGLCDTYGNVEEWCADWYAERHYASSAEDDPTGPRLGRDRVVRGGSLGVDPYFARSASRSMAGAGGRAASCGFRVVCVAKALAPGSPTEYP